jgi:hypothetical protein
MSQEMLVPLLNAENFSSFISSSSEILCFYLRFEIRRWNGTSRWQMQAENSSKRVVSTYIYGARLWRLSICLSVSQSASLSVYLSIYGSTALFLDFAAIFFQFLDLLHSRYPWTGDQPVTSPLPSRRTAERQNKCIQASMPQVGFELTTPVLERAMTGRTQTARPLWSASEGHM